MLNLRHVRGCARPLAFAVATAAALVAGACTSTTGTQTGPLSLAVEDTGQLFALTGSQPYYPSGLNLTTRNVVVVSVFDDGTVAFDVAFDILPNGKVKVLPPRTVAIGPNTLPNSLDLYTPTGATWSSLTEAPQSGYIRDTAQVINVGQPIVMQVRPSLCSLQVLNALSAKFVVDSVNPTTRKIFFRLLANPNCGRRGLVPNQY
jgi:hypothetical protein